MYDDWTPTSRNQENVWPGRGLNTNSEAVFQHSSHTAIIYERLRLWNGQLWTGLCPLGLPVNARPDFIPESERIQAPTTMFPCHCVRNKIRNLLGSVCCVRLYGHPFAGFIYGLSLSMFGIHKWPDGFDNQRNLPNHVIRRLLYVPDARMSTLTVRHRVSGSIWRERRFVKDLSLSSLLHLIRRQVCVES